MKKLVCLAMVCLMVLISGFALAQGQKPILTPEQEKAAEKLGQDMALLNLLLRIQQEESAVKEVIGRLEVFKTDDVVLKKQIEKWIPVLKKYCEALGKIQDVMNEVLAGKDIITEEEFQSKLKNVYPQELAVAVQDTVNEIKNSGILQKLFPPEG